MDETILLIFELKNCPMVFDKLQRSNFCILGLRTARLHSKTAAQIFDEKILGMIDQIFFMVSTLRINFVKSNERTWSDRKIRSTVILRCNKAQLLGYFESFEFAHFIFVVICSRSRSRNPKALCRTAHFINYAAYSNSSAACQSCMQLGLQ